MVSRAASQIAARMSADVGADRCAVPDCLRPTMASSGVGLAKAHCRYHVQFRARHGSHWCPSYRASDLRPYVQAAALWLRLHRTAPIVVAAIRALDGLLARAGWPEPARNIRRWPAKARAKVAFARLREAGIKPERLLAINMGMRALIEDDRGSHRTEEFRQVQVAKAVHRLASGTHRRWDFPLPDGRTSFFADHTYPKSSGLVLRVIGREIGDICGTATEVGLEAVRRLKTERSGEHPSELPGWRPLWARQREAARKGG